MRARLAPSNPCSRNAWPSTGSRSARSATVFGTSLEPEVAEAGMVGRPRLAAVPVVFAVGRLDRQVVDAGVAQAHQAFGVELPVLVAVRAEPVAGVVVPFV